MSNEYLTEQDTWKALQTHQEQMRDVHMRDLFAEDPARAENFSAEINGLFLDYSKHIITADVMESLINLAKECDIEAQRDQMFAGAPVNTSEDRPALHVALRGSVDKGLEIDGENVTDFVNETLKRIEKLSNEIRNEGRFTDVVSIGIGGSDIGPHMVCAALQNYADGPNIHFVSNIDGAHITQILADLNPETTLFIIASKTFTTLETMENASVAKNWIIKSCGEAAVFEHFIAVTMNDAGAGAFGISAEHILPMREWIGGRYSLWSAIGLPIAISIGFNGFKNLLAGARAMDDHFRAAPLEKNMPVIMALLGIWYRNFWDFGAHAILPYAQNLHKFPAYVQQLDMESNGKSIDKNGQRVGYNTSPVVFGEPGTDGQHAFFQMLHQGTDIIPADFIAAINHEHELDAHHTKLLANALAQSQAFMNGRAVENEPHRTFEGNRPSSTLLLDSSDAHHLGMVLALYEHKIFVQGCIWNINSFDQWGVELGKDLAKNITEALENNKESQGVDSSTNGLVRRINANKNKNS